MPKLNNTCANSLRCTIALVSDAQTESSVYYASIMIATQ